MPPRRAPTARANTATEGQDVPEDADGEQNGSAMVGDVRAIEGLDAREELPFLQLPDGGEDGSLPPRRYVPAFMLVATALPACTLSPNVADRSAFAIATTILTTLKSAALVRIFNTLRGLGALSTRDAPLTFGGFLRGLSATRRKASAEQLSALTDLPASAANGMRLMMIS